MKKLGNSAEKTSGAGRLITLSLAAAVLLPAGQAYAQLAVACTRALQFATFAPCGGGGSIKVTPAGGVTNIGCVALVGAPKQALCEVKSFATSGSIQVKLAATTTKVSGPGTMQLKNFNIGTAGGGPTKTWTDAALTKTPLDFGVGGSLEVNVGEANGVYSGNVVMTVIFTP